MYIEGGNAYRVTAGVLESAAVLEDGDVDDETWGEVTLMESAGTLRRINLALGEAFPLDAFPGR